MDSTTSRRMHRVIEPVHAMIYFAPEAQEEYEALGLSGMAELYFPSRAAARDGKYSSAWPLSPSASYSSNASGAK